MPPETDPQALLDVAEVERLIDEHFPGLHAGGRSIEIESVGHLKACCRLKPGKGSIRPGGTVSGPALFTLADFSVYVALIANLGAPAIPAVTSNLNINFLLRPTPSDILAETTI